MKLYDILQENINVGGFEVVIGHTHDDDLKASHISIYPKTWREFVLLSLVKQARAVQLRNDTLDFKINIEIAEASELILPRTTGISWDWSSLEMYFDYDDAPSQAIVTRWLHNITEIGKRHRLIDNISIANITVNNDYDDHLLVMHDPHFLPGQVLLKLLAEYINAGTWKFLVKCEPLLYGFDVEFNDVGHQFTDNMEKGFKEKVLWPFFIECQKQGDKVFDEIS